MQQTQISYEDPEARVWRERVTIKMAGGKVMGKEGTASGKGGSTPGKQGNTPGRKGRSATTTAANRDGGLGIAKRTRQAVG